MESSRNQNETFDFDISTEQSLGQSSSSNASNSLSWFDKKKSDHEKKLKRKSRKSMRTNILIKNMEKENQPVAEPVKKKPRTTILPTKKGIPTLRLNVVRETEVKKESKGFKFNVKKSTTTKPNPFNFMKREERRKKLKEKDENQKTETEIDTGITAKGNIRVEGPKRRYSRVRLAELAKPKHRPRIKDDEEEKQTSSTDKNPIAKRQITKAISPGLHSKRRAEERKRLLADRAARMEILEKKKAEEESRKKIEDDKKLVEHRQNLVHRPKPISKFKKLPKKEVQPITSPETPKFTNRKRKQN